MVKDFLKYYFRTGKLFRSYSKELEETEKFSLAELAEYKNEKLKKIIKIAYEEIPFYQKLFKERRLTPNDINTLEDIQKLPIIDKKIVQTNFRDFRTCRFKGLVFKGYTSGTTGSPGVFLRDLDSANFEHAQIWRSYRWIGKSFNSKRVTLRGNLVVSIENKNLPFWKYNFFDKELVMSSYHLSDEYLKYYIEKIRDFGAFDLFAYPSTAYLLANFCNRVKEKIKFAAVFTSSEMLYDYQREEIEKAFKAKVFDWYGNAERVAAICQCEKGVYHEVADYSVVEYLPVSEGKYEIIGTTLNNFVMPLIRYRTGDIVEFEKDSLCSCGRNFKRIKRIFGRDDDVIILKDGRKLGRLDHIFKGVDFIKEAQIIQITKGLIELKIVPLGNFSEKNKKNILEKLDRYIGSQDIAYKINKVENIEREKNAKFKLVRNLMREE